MARSPSEDIDITAFFITRDFTGVRVLFVMVVLEKAGKWLICHLQHCLQAKGE